MQDMTERLIAALGSAITVLDGNGFHEFAKTLKITEDAANSYQQSNQVLFERDAQASYDDEMKDLRSIFSQETSNEDAETRTDERAEGVLEYTQKTSVHILLTTGGPARGYVVFLDSDNEPDSGYYWYQGWYQPKRVFWLDREELRQVCDVYNVGAF